MDNVQKPLPSEKIWFWPITCMPFWLHDEARSEDWLKCSAGYGRHPDACIDVLSSVSSLMTTAVMLVGARSEGQPDDSSMDRSEDPTRREGWIRSC